MITPCFHVPRVAQFQTKLGILSRCHLAVVFCDMGRYVINFFSKASLLCRSSHLIQIPALDLRLVRTVLLFCGHDGQSVVSRGTQLPGLPCGFCFSSTPIPVPIKVGVAKYSLLLSVCLLFFHVS
jgi:hypothetical protein